MRAKHCQFISAGVDYKKALPREKWSAMEHFLRALTRCGQIAQREGRKIDVSWFLKEKPGDTLLPFCCLGVARQTWAWRMRTIEISLW